jgi:hypothetical protein
VNRIRDRRGPLAAGETAQPPREGIIYVTVGAPLYARWCLFSAASARRACPDVGITVFTDSWPRKLARPAEGVIDRFIPVERGAHPLKLKVTCMKRSPYDRTLYLDADTYVRKPVDEIFDWLREYDLCLTPEVKAEWEDETHPFIAYTDERFINTGVIGFANSIPVGTLFREWEAAMAGQDESDMAPGHNCDQEYFNRLWAAGYGDRLGLRVRRVSNKVYNVRSQMVEPLKRDGAWEQTKILHHRGIEGQPAPSWWRRVRRRMRLRSSVLGTLERLGWAVRGKERRAHD